MAEKKTIFRVAQKLDVIDERLETGQKDIYFSRVEDVRENSLLILPPFQKGFTMPPRIGRVIKAKVVAEKVPYVFESTLLKYIADQIPLWEVSRPEQMQKVQLRDNVRLSIVLDVSLEVLDPEGTGEGKVIKTLTRDISAGGMLVVLPETLHSGTKVKVHLPLAKHLVIDTEGEVRRLVPPATDAERLSAGIQFINLDEKIQNQVLRYIFAKEAEIRQKDRIWRT